MAARKKDEPAVLETVPAVLPVTIEEERLAQVLDVPASLGLVKLALSAADTIEALRAEVAARPVVAPSDRPEWKAKLVAAIDALPAPDWKATAVAQVLDHAPVVNADAVTAALAELGKPWLGKSKRAVKNGPGVVDALEAAGWSVARVVDGDVIVRAR